MSNDTEASLSTRRLETRDRIFAAARAQFSAQGYDGATIRSIAQAAGVSAATVMIYGSSKAALAEVLYREEVDALFHSTLAAVPEAAPVPVQLAQVFGALLAYFAEERAPALVLLRLMVLPEGGGALLDDYVAQIAPLIVRAQSRDRVRADLDAAALARTVVQIYTGVLADLLRHPDQSGAAAQGALRAALRTLWEGASPWR